MDMTQILDLAIKLLVALAVAFFIPWLRKLLGSEKLADAQAYVKIFVRAVEQLFAATDGGAKKEWVLEQLEKKGIHIDGTALDAIIEAAVHELHQALEHRRQAADNGAGQ